MISKFGQSVRLEIYSNKEMTDKVFNTDGLRVDFHIKVIPGLNRAKFTIYNMNGDTIRQVVNGERYVKMFVRLHDRAEQEFGYSFYINNAMNIKAVPDQITELYCVDSLRKDFSLKQIQMTLKKPTLEKYCTEVSRIAGKPIKFDFSSLPEQLLKYVPPNPEAIWSGSAMDAIQAIAVTYNSEVYIDEGSNNITLIFKPLHNNQRQSNQNKSTYYKLSTINMRANPRIGVAQMEVNSNLDLNIKAGTLFDTSELLTAASFESQDTLTIANGLIKNYVSGNSIYQVLSVEHKGSNYTKDWNTLAMAVKAYKGTTSPTYGWGI